MLAVACQSLATPCASSRQKIAIGRKQRCAPGRYSDAMKLRTSRAAAAFTLIELLVVIAIVGILSSLLLPALARGKQKAKQVNELSAGKQLILAWHLHADENDNVVLP